MDSGNGGQWVSISEAARQLGVTRQAVRGRIGRGTLETRTETVGNRQRLRVRLPEPLPEPVREPLPERLPEPNTAALLAEKEVELARLQERLAAAEEIKTALRERVAELKTELAAERERREAVERTLAERQRRPWPGLQVWWRRFVYGEG